MIIHRRRRKIFLRGKRGVGPEVLRRHLNFRQISHRFRAYIEFYQSLFSRSERLTYYVLKYDNFKSVEVQGWTPLKILIFLHWTCRPTFTTLLGKRRAISHLMAVPKNSGKCKSATISLHRGDSLSASGPLSGKHINTKTNILWTVKNFMRGWRALFSTWIQSELDFLPKNL